MKILKISKDGGSKSHVTGLFLWEIKSLCSLVILKFDKGSRNNFHSHAFNAVTFWLPFSHVTEYLLKGGKQNWKFGFKWTPKNCFHRIFAHKTSYAISFRGKWNDCWLEHNPSKNQRITLTNGRKVVKVEDSVI